MALGLLPRAAEWVVMTFHSFGEKCARCSFKEGKSIAQFGPVEFKMPWREKTMQICQVSSWIGVWKLKGGMDEKDKYQHCQHTRDT